MAPLGGRAMGRFSKSSLPVSQTSGHGMTAGLCGPLLKTGLCFGAGDANHGAGAVDTQLTAGDCIAPAKECQREPASCGATMCERNRSQPVRTDSGMSHRLPVGHWLRIMTGYVTLWQALNIARRDGAAGQRAGGRWEKGGAVANRISRARVLPCTD